MKTYYFLSGLPRSGSTLLSSILNQNPDIHAPGNSPVCQLMWDTHVSITQSAREQIQANKKQDISEYIVKSIPETYHSDTDKPYVIDKCRSWTITANIDLIKQYITENPKIIILLRPIDEIVKSFAQLRIDNNWEDDPFVGLLEPGSEPIMRSLAGILQAKETAHADFILIDYSELVDNTEHVLDELYKFLDLPRFDHDLTNIVNNLKEDDTVYGLIGQHDVRSTLGSRKIDMDLPTYIQDKCDTLNKLLYATEETKIDK